jgi:hypothetical protein
MIIYYRKNGKLLLNLWYMRTVVQGIGLLDNLDTILGNYTSDINFEIRQFISQ